MIYSFSIDVIVDFAYGMICAGLTPEGITELDENLAKLSEEEVIPVEPVVEKKLSDGRVVKLSQARLDRLRANAAGMANKPKKGDWT